MTEQTTETYVNMGLFMEVQSAFFEEIECEHRQHKDQPQYHSGKAAWYAQAQCPNCGNISTLKPVCDKWVRAVESGGKVVCSRSCGEVSTDWTFVVKERIKK